MAGWPATKRPCLWPLEGPGAAGSKKVATSYHSLFGESFRKPSSRRGIQWQRSALRVFLAPGGPGGGRRQKVCVFCPVRAPGGGRGQKSETFNWNCITGRRQKSAWRFLGPGARNSATVQRFVAPRHGIQRQRSTLRVFLAPGRPGGGRRQNVCGFAPWRARGRPGPKINDF